MGTYIHGTMPLTVSCGMGIRKMGETGSKGSEAWVDNASRRGSHFKLHRCSIHVWMNHEGDVTKLIRVYPLTSVAEHRCPAWSKTRALSTHPANSVYQNPAVFLV